MRGATSSEERSRSMDEERETFRHDPRALSRRLFDRAKRLWGLALLLQLGVFALGLALTFSPGSGWAGFLLAVSLVLSVGSEIVTLRYETAKGNAESLLRKLDFRNSFGWGLTKAEMRDFLAQSPARLTKGLTTEELGEEYFASSEGMGARRALENVQESAWWSRHLAGNMGWLCAVGALVLLLAPITPLIAILGRVNHLQQLPLIAQVTTSALMLVFTIGLGRLSFSYFAFSRECRNTETATENLLASNVDEKQAIRVMHEYHLARAGAPPLPLWLWKLRNRRLNELWEGYRPSS